jgi:alkylhydroperoxidase/carboxymuconolactone decarboxylase family protein YurZ
VADVVAVADVGEVEAARGAEVLFRVMKSASAWQGCSKSESALMTGTRELAAISVMVSCA